MLGSKALGSNATTRAQRRPVSATVSTASAKLSWLDLYCSVGFSPYSETGLRYLKSNASPIPIDEVEYICFFALAKGGWVRSYLTDGPSST